MDIDWDTLYLENLEKKVHENGMGIVKQGLLKRPFERLPLKTFHYEYFLENKLTEREIEGALTIIQKEDKELILFPEKKDIGIAYTIHKGTGLHKIHLPLLTFAESQLPENYGWEKLSEIFLSGRNLQLMQKYQLGEIKDKEFYEG